MDDYEKFWFECKVENLKKENENLLCELKRMQEENARLEKENADLESSNTRLYNDTKDEIRELKAEIERLRKKCVEVSNITADEEKAASDKGDDCLIWNTQYVSKIMKDLNYKKFNIELQEQHQQDCIRYNDMRTAFLKTVDELAMLRKQLGVGQ